MSSFVDEAQLHVRAGNGGAGGISFRREAHVPQGGPDGGDGGRGGNVWLVADSNVRSLLAFRDRPFRRASDGGSGRGGRRHGANGADIEVLVPPGTVVHSLGGEQLVDLARPGHRWLAAEGGRGGRGNAHFLSNRRRAPAFGEQGEVGQEFWLNLELKLMADVALVGMPNAGKSTLIAAISSARPKIADYPFTTLVPNLGVVRVAVDQPDLVVADIPGLIEGASEGKGLGHRFLRHIERARVLCILADLSRPDGLSPDEQVGLLLAELSAHQPELLTRPRVVVGTKADLVPPGDRPEGLPVISAATGEGLTGLVYELSHLFEEARAGEDRVEEVFVHQLRAEGFEVERTGPTSFVVRGRPAERAVALSDLTLAEALAEAQRRLARLGVDRALARAGARDGDQVRIGDLILEYSSNPQS
jgi:GTP-binding protein